MANCKPVVHREIARGTRPFIPGNFPGKAISDYLGTGLRMAVVSGGLATQVLANAATPDAWAAHDREVTSACVKASNLRGARPGGKIIEFDDRVGFTGLVIDGRYPQPHMKNQPGRVLCLFDKRTRTAFVSAADLLVRRGK